MIIVPSEIMFSPIFSFSVNQEVEASDNVRYYVFCVYRGDLIFTHAENYFPVKLIVFQTMFKCYFLAFLVWS